MLLRVVKVLPKCSSHHTPVGWYCSREAASIQDTAIVNRHESRHSQWSKMATADQTQVPPYITYSNVVQCISKISIYIYIEMYMYTYIYLYIHLFICIYHSANKLFGLHGSVILITAQCSWPWSTHSCDSRIEKWHSPRDPHPKHWTLTFTAKIIWGIRTWKKHRSLEKAILIRHTLELSIGHHKLVLNGSAAATLWWKTRGCTSAAIFAPVYITFEHWSIQCES